MRLGSIAMLSLVAGVLCQGLTACSNNSANASNQEGPKPQVTVECSGWHALCSLATDCRATGGEQADCACWKVNEQHMIMTSNIKNETFGGAPIKEDTRRRCTTDTPCGLDEAPVCGAIQDLLETDAWVSTYSYRGWCDHWDPVKCELYNAGPWADCMTSPCVVSADPTDPNRPLSCQCTLNNGPYVGTNGTCSRKNSNIVMSTIERFIWNFNDNEFAIAVPGYSEYVKSACAPIQSDEE